MRSRQRRVVCDVRAEIIACHVSDENVGLLHLYQADTVSVYQRIRLFVCANSVKTADSDTYQEIPDTGHF
jgi:hypothetical protein